MKQRKSRLLKTKKREKYETSPDMKIPHPKLLSEKAAASRGLTVVGEEGPGFPWGPLFRRGLEVLFR